MVHLSDILRRIKRQIVDPEIKQIKGSTVGYVTAVNLNNQTADILLIERDGTRRRRSGLPFPQTGSGVIQQALKPGDRVEVAYRNSNYQSIYIARLNRDDSHQRHIADGQGLPRSTDLF